jgi:hypothetical protein
MERCMDRKTDGDMTNRWMDVQTVGESKKYSRKVLKHNCIVTGNNQFVEFIPTY